MNVLIENIKDGIKGDRFLWTIIILLSLCSLLAVYSASISLTKYNSDNTIFFLLKHVPFIIGGLILAWFISNIDYTEFSKWAPFFLIVAVALLVWALFFGVNINQAKRWIQVPFLDISF